MNRDEAKQFLPIIQAMADGKRIQYRVTDTSPWADIDDLHAVDPPDHYRIKPEPTLRPWKPEEVPLIAMIRRKSGLGEVHVAHRNKALEGRGMMVMGGGFGPSENMSAATLCEYWVRISEDGTEHPCGVLEAQP